MVVVDSIRETKGLRFEISWQAKRAKDTIRDLRFKSKVKSQKSNDYGKEAKSIGDCGEDCSSCTHSVFDSTRNDQLHAMHDVTVIG